MFSGPGDHFTIILLLYIVSYPILNNIQWFRDGTVEGDDVLRTPAFDQKCQKQENQLWGRQSTKIDQKTHFANKNECFGAKIRAGWELVQKLVLVASMRDQGDDKLSENLQSNDSMAWRWNGYQKVKVPKISLSHLTLSDSMCRSSVSWAPMSMVFMIFQLIYID